MRPLSLLFILQGLDKRGHVDLREDNGEEYDNTADIFARLHDLLEENSRADNAKDRFKRENDRRGGRVHVLLCNDLQGEGDTARANSKIEKLGEKLADNVEGDRILDNKRNGRA